MSEIGSALRKELGADRVFDDEETLAAHRVDYWILAHLRRRQGRLGPPPACVVKPRNTAEVLRRYRKVLVPELNCGQLRMLLRSEFLVDAVGLNKVQGKPFLVSEVEQKIEELVRS